MILHSDAYGPGKAVGCDACHEVLEPGERATPRGPWTAAEALSAAEGRGWFISATCHVCPGWHSLAALESLEAKAGSL